MTTKKNVSFDDIEKIDRLNSNLTNEIKKLLT